jgi:hypothetical protein
MSLGNGGVSTCLIKIVSGEDMVVGEDLETIRNRKWEFARHLLPPIPLPAAAMLLANERRFENHWGTIPTLHTNLEDVELACSYFEIFHFSSESETFG